MSIKISRHFYDVETTVTQQRGIDNSIPAEIKPAVANTALRMDSVRDLLGTPIIVSSWYRCPSLNKKVGSGVRSQHLKGEAVDFISPAFGTPLQIVQTLAKYADTLRFDQLILEHTWVHISFLYDTSRDPRKQVLTLLESKKYANGITDIDGNPIT